MSLTETEKLQRQMIEVCPFRIGQRVTISPTFKYAADWPDQYVITGIRWEYQRGSEVNLSIAHDNDIVNRDGDTDGFGVHDLVPVVR